MVKHERIVVWDPLVRFFHWTLVLSFFIAYITEDELLNIHVLAGYYISGLLLLRIIWGLIGSKYARFSNFVFAPTTIRQYLKDLVRLKAKHYVGHNPAGGAMVIVMLITLILTALSGMATYAAEEQAGPLLLLAQDWNGDWMEEIHEFFANTMLGLVVIHILGVVVSSLLHGENLIRAMWTGFKDKQE